MEPTRARESEALGGGVGVVGGSKSMKDHACEGRRPAGEEGTPVGEPGRSQSRHSSIEAGNDRGAKGGRKVNREGDMPGENQCPSVPPETGDKQGQEDLWQRYGAEHGVWSPKMLAALDQGVKGNKWFSLIDKVYQERTLALAWEKVRIAAGAAGGDGITVGYFAQNSQERLLVVKEHLMAGTYQPRPVKRVWIPKPGSAEKRPLGIPTVRDRVVQTAVRLAIEPVFEREFAPHSYGFRPGRSCKDALRRVEGLLKSGLHHVVEVDIQGYFDAIPRERLLALVAQHVADGRVLSLIERFLEQGVMEGAELWQPETGTPQGGPLSPLLANIYLNPLDWLMAGMGVEMVRYADDLVVLCDSAEHAQNVLETIRQWMVQAGLTLHPDKTRVVDMTRAGNSFEFLGYRFRRGKDGKIQRYLRRKSLVKLREKLKPLTRRTNGQNLRVLCAQLEPILRGWYGYFKHLAPMELAQIDGWLRARLRAILNKRHHYGQGHGKGPPQSRWPNCYFTELGLFCLQAAQAQEIAFLQRGANH